MKKFCGECGNPLEVSKKFCSDCGTNNPYFSIVHEAPSGSSGAVDELKARKENIERELEELEREQAEVRDKETLRREMEELHKERMARLEKQKEIKERFERQEIEASFKKEILQVREETELYKQHTHNLLVELRNVIVQIDDENKRLKEEVQQIVQAKPVEQYFVSPEIIEEEPIQQEVIIPEPVREELIIEEPEVQQMIVAEALIEALVTQEAIVEEPVVREAIMQEPRESEPVLEEPAAEYLAPNLEPEIFEPLRITVAEIDDTHPLAEVETQSSGNGKLIAAALLGFLAISVGLGVYLYQGSGSNATISQAAAVKAQPAEQTNTTVTGNEGVNTATAAIVPEVTTTLETTPIENPPTTAPAAKPKASAVLTLPLFKAKADLVGKTLSGCGITLGSAAEIDRMGEPVMVENSPTLGYVKYKVDMNVSQDGEQYHVTSYMYYTPAGKFMRVDASNCE